MGGEYRLSTRLDAFLSRALKSEGDSISTLKIICVISTICFNIKLKISINQKYLCTKIIQNLIYRLIGILNLILE